MLRHVEELYGLTFHLCGFMQCINPLLLMFATRLRGFKGLICGLMSDRFALNLFIPCGLVFQVHLHPL